MACTECHAAKVKCDNSVVPCIRCRRLGRVCVRHISQQGKHKKKRKRETPAAAHTEDAALSAQVSALHADHYGLQYLVRSWVSIAIRRRSISLLGRAASVADRCGLTMDQLLCDTQREPGMGYLGPILATPAPQQHVVGPRLEWPEVPTTLLAAVGCHGLPDRRWIWMRDMNMGISRYLVTPGFEEDIVDLATMHHTHIANKQSVIDLILPPDSKEAHTQAFAHQISMHDVPGTPPQASRLSKVNLKTRNRGIVQVDQVSCLLILSLERAIYYIEYIEQMEVKKPAYQTMGGAQVATQPNLDLGSSFLDLDDLLLDKESKDLDFFLGLLR